MDRHVEQQHVIHLLTKAAEVRREKEIGVNAGERAYRAGMQRPRNTPDSWHIATILNDRMDAAGGPSARDEIACVDERLSHRLFAQDVTTRRKASANDPMTRRRHNDVKQQFRMTARQKLVNVFGDDDVLQGKFSGTTFRPLDVEVSQTDDPQIGNFRGGAEPSSAHCATADEGGLQLQLRLHPIPTIDVATITVNVYDASGAPSPCQGASRASNNDDADLRRFERAATRFASGWRNAVIGIRDLARHLDISIGTVSRALNDRADVNPLTRQRVREAAAKLGYSPNQSGRSLRRGKTDLVAMIVPSRSDDTLINTVFLSVLDGLKRRLGEDGLDLAIFLEGEKDSRLASLRRVTERGLADALIIADTLVADPRVEYLVKLRRPFVTFGRTKAAARHAWVDPDFEAAIEGAVAHLAALGHRRIGLALPKVGTNYVDLVESGYRRAMRSRGFAIDEGWDVRRPAGERGGVEAADALLAAAPRPTAIVLTDSMHAAALYRRLSEAGLRPGRDVSILALLPEARAQYLIPTLTSYQTDWTKIGRRLGEAVIAEIARSSSERSAQDASAKANAKPDRLQFKMAVEFSPGESVERVDAAE
jgi:DNA-binding LacI/PurR family transcriptional regulator